ncbi:hypothetical protein PHYBLDRAFT_143746 [Phycomyces blakesleeanus NRRL 1555(-)]|uniref:Uncharacterized protein n=1 Tax=Phycomyces blakesleeanus (strain ATCC 8743b / DSM 1359 / FGSC 10004 / NBRC 33097 / NRRL 1555) TaxID=763407 RepID=A0A167NAJ1_PHYB8|nr:hypothetical protein PHYBLDRAFT_143746 [Phycomyces blakesleeanus NRRL 1555(-)]OAD75499.1 hypothetical protein PHYBLDRAFT_143746 [Phycomyces blakesleeanus NRRL 1555(-)]|eukprot:XP_018293539.1 hypothetical protein PHYBLDRAFT_143746 [Phycomyces blakesleeanus NRRL 1555(-)]
MEVKILTYISPQAVKDSGNIIVLLQKLRYNNRYPWRQPGIYGIRSAVFFNCVVMLCLRDHT